MMDNRVFLNAMHIVVQCLHRILGRNLHDFENLSGIKGYGYDFAQFVCAGIRMELTS